jgi:tetratricopeptide (TPR) repeat protein
MSLDKRALLDRYEIRGDEADFLAAKPLYERSIADTPDPTLLRDYGYLLECHARNELRQAVDQYKRAIDLDPDAEQVRYQLIAALGALRDTDEMIALYQQRVAAAPGKVQEYRFLAGAYLAAGAKEEARRVIDAGLEQAGDDPALLALRGEIAAASGEAEAALADWRRALELDKTMIGPLFSSAYLLEREGRLEEAMESWRSILDLCEAHGDELGAEFPERELARLRRRITTG